MSEYDSFLQRTELIDTLVTGINLSKVLNASEDVAENARLTILTKANELYANLSSKELNLKNDVLAGVSVFVACNMYASEPVTQNYFQKFGISINKALKFLLSKKLIDETFVMYSRTKKY